jgi:hypothetical protein
MCNCSAFIAAQTAVDSSLTETKTQVHFVQNLHAHTATHCSKEMQCGTLVPIPTTELGQLGISEAERAATEAANEAAAAANVAAQPPAAAARDTAAAAAAAEPLSDAPPATATTAGAAAAETGAASNTAAGAKAAGSTAAETTAAAGAGASSTAADSTEEQQWTRAGSQFNLEERMAVYEQQLIERGVTGDEAVKLTTRRRAQLSKLKLRATPQQARDLLRLKADCLIIATR